MRTMHSEQRSPELEIGTRDRRCFWPEPAHPECFLTQVQALYLVAASRSCLACSKYLSWHVGAAATGLKARPTQVDIVTGAFRDISKISAFFFQRNKDLQV